MEVSRLRPVYLYIAAAPSLIIVSGEVHALHDCKAERCSSAAHDRSVGRSKTGETALFFEFKVGVTRCIRMGSQSAPLEQ